MININNYISEKLHISKDLVKPRIWTAFEKTGFGKYVPKIFDTPQEALQFIIDNNVSIKAIYGFKNKGDAEKLTDITYKMVRSQIDKETAEKMKQELDYVMIKGDDVEQIIAGKANIEDFLTEKLHIDKNFDSSISTDDANELAYDAALNVVRKFCETELKNYEVTIKNKGVNQGIKVKIEGFNWFDKIEKNKIMQKVEKLCRDNKDCCEDCVMNTIGFTVNPIFILDKKYFNDLKDK